MELFFSVGEPSGDLHGANLIRELQARDPEIRVRGFGGPRMASAGCQLDADLTQWAVMWFAQVFIHLGHFIRLLWRADRIFRHQRPDGVILIDYPGFNWWIARRAKAHRIPVFYYGAPQMWAWAGWRVGKMRRLVDHVLCKLPFEAEWYQQRGCRALYVGHPYFDELTQHTLDEPFIEQQRGEGPLITLLPGSRRQEVSAHLEDFLRIVNHLRRLSPSTRFAWAAFNPSQAATAEAAIRAAGLPISVHSGRTPELIHAADLCLACSGSVSLELMYHGKPSIIYYRISRWAFRIQRYFRKVRFITLVNLLACEDRYCTRGEMYDPQRDTVPFPEYLTCEDRTEEVAQQLHRWLEAPAERERIGVQLGLLNQSFAVPGASRRAANYVVDALIEPSRARTTPSPRQAA